MVTLAATPSDSPTTPEPSCSSTSHKGSLTVPCQMPRCPAPREGLWQPGREGGDAVAQDARTWLTPATPEFLVQSLVDLELPVKGCLSSCSLGPHHSSCRVGDAPQMVVQVSPRCGCGECTQRNLASWRLRKKPKNHCSQRAHFQNSDGGNE